MPDQDTPPSLSQLLAEAAAEIPVITLAGCLSVEAVVIPHALGHLQPVCAYADEHGEHRIPTEFVWRELSTHEVYCHIWCAASAAMRKASDIAYNEKLLTRAGNSS